MTGQDPVDRGTVHDHPVGVFQVPGDRVGTGIQPSRGQRAAEFQDRRDHRGRRGGRGALRPPGAWAVGGLALTGPTGHQPRYPALGHRVGAGHLGLGCSSEHGHDHQALLRHAVSVERPPGQRSKPCRCRATSLFRCPATPYSYVLHQHTLSRTFWKVSQQVAARPFVFPGNRKILRPNRLSASPTRANAFARPRWPQILPKPTTSRPGAEPGCRGGGGDLAGRQRRQPTTFTASWLTNRRPSVSSP